MQLPVPQAPDTLTVPLPAAFEQWRDLYLHGGFQKLVAFLVVAVVLLLIARLARRQVTESVDDVNRRHTLRKLIGYATALLIFVFGIALFADFLAGFGTLFAVLLAGVAIALQDILRSVVGWLYLSTRRSAIDIGTRVEVGQVTGDVIDIGVLKTTVMEVGNLVFGLQSTGRLVTIPNNRMLNEAVVVSGRDNPFVWHEVKIAVTFESDWRRAEEILREAGDELHGEIAAELAAAFARMERRYAFKYGTLTPIVYLTLAERGVELVLRYLTPVRRRRGSEDRVVRHVVAAIAAEPAVAFAYPTYRMFRRGEGAGPPAVVPMPEAGLDPGGEEGLPPPEVMPE
jgi:small-conductance mechanosensitive channel